MKLITLLILFVFTLSVGFAMDLNSMIRVRDRLRIELWMDGVPEFSDKQKEAAPKEKAVPEELLRALDKMDL